MAGNNGNGDIGAQQATYHKVLGMLKWGAIGSFLIAFVVIWLIAG